MNGQLPDDLLALLRGTAPRPGAAGPGCLDDETIAAIVEGILDPLSRTAATAHLVSCARCRRAVAAVSGMLADVTVAAAAAEVERGVSGGLRRWRLPIGLAAAAALLLVLAWPRRADDGGPPHRAPPITAVAAPVPMSPVGAVAEARTLRWAAVAGADRYRVTLFDAGGRVLFETQLADTVAALPDSVVIVPARAYLWKVEARTGWDRWATSELVEFAIAGGTPR